MHSQRVHSQAVFINTDVWFSYLNVYKRFVTLNGNEVFLLLVNIFPDIASYFPDQSIHNYVQPHSLSIGC